MNSIRILTKGRLRRFPPFVCILLLTTLGACHNTDAGNVALQGSSPPEKIHAIDLAIAGYNYTDRYINDFTLNGNSGGNLYVSSATGGGGGTTCCATYVTGDKAWKVRVEWQTGGCTYDNSVNDDGSPVYSIHPYYREVELQIETLVPEDPKYLEVHFYPDGHVQVTVTAKRSAPHLTLAKTHENKTTRLVRCPDDRRPRS